MNKPFFHIQDYFKQFGLGALIILNLISLFVLSGPAGGEDKEADEI